MRTESVIPRMPATPPVAGRDARLPHWLERGGAPEAPLFDSVVVRGAGIGALVCAGRLARSEALRAHVTIAGSRPPETRRLTGGLTLRARAIDYYCRALGVSRERLLGEMFGDRIEQAETRSQTVAVLRWRGSEIELVRPTVWMTSEEKEGRVLAYGGRNAQIAHAIGRCIDELDIDWQAESPDRVSECQALARGENPLVIDAATHPLEDYDRPDARQLVVASQLLFSDPEREARGVLPKGGGFSALTAGPAGNDIGVFSPVADPLSPDASWYGIFYRIVPNDDRFDREHELAGLRKTLIAAGRAVGFEAIDPDETLGEAAIPCSDWRDATSVRSDVLELHRIAHAGAPIITGDGMTRAGLTGLVAAEAVLQGECPNLHCNRATRRWRSMNRLFAQGMTWMSPLTLRVSALAPRFSIRQVQDRPHMWAGL